MQKTKLSKNKLNRSVAKAFSKGFLWGTLDYSYIVFTKKDSEPILGYQYFRINNNTLGHVTYC